MKLEGRIVYTNGTEDTFECGNAALAAWERYAMRKKLPMGVESPPTLSSLVIAHHALRIEEGFDAWADTVSEIECAAVEVPPTLAAVRADNP